VVAVAAVLAFERGGGAWRRRHFGLEHFPEKACPALDAGWIPVFRRKCDQTGNLERFPIQPNWKAL
jgi:hypothetical protein